MKSYITVSLNNLLRVLSLLLQGYLFGSRFARFEFRRSFLRPWLNSLGGMGAWLLVLLACASGVVALWGLLWLGFSLGFVM